MFMHIVVVLPEAVPLLVGVIQSPESRVKENVNATENCISAVAKVMKYRPECVNVNEILLIGCPGCHSTRIKRKLSTHSTISVTSLKGACLSADGNSGSL